MNNEMGGRCLSMFSGGLDSMLAVCVLRAQGIHVEGVVFDSPFFDITTARHAAEQLGIRLHVLDFISDITALLDNPPHGFGGNMNPCIDCHARMIQRTGQLMEELGFDAIATGEVMGQRPMSQNRVSLDIVQQSSGYGDYLVRPLSAQLLPPSKPEREGLIDRTRLLALSGRSRKPQMALAVTYGITKYPAPAGGCLLTDEGFCRRLADLMAHEGLAERRLLRLLRTGRHMRLPDGTKCIIGRNKEDNATLLAAAVAGDALLDAVDTRGPTVMLPGGARSAADKMAASKLCVAYGAADQPALVTVAIRVGTASEQVEVKVEPRGEFSAWLL